MKRILVGIMALSLTAFAGNTVKLKKPPKELDKYYPPNAKAPLFLYNMYQASTSFTGMLTNVQQKDWKNAEKWAGRLKESYFKIEKMVPSWKKYLRKNEMEKLVEAVKNKNIANIRKYANLVGQSCSNCHKKNMLPVKVKYHYPSVDLISIEDPVSGMDYSVEDYMKKLSTSYKLTKVFFDDDKTKRALKSAVDFTKRFKALTQSCSECHTNKIVENVYFGKETNEALRNLVQSVRQKNKKNFMQAMNSIGGVCYKCHNVHETPLMLKSKLEK